MTCTDGLLVAALVRDTLKQFGLDIPGTVYFDEGLDHLSDKPFADGVRHFKETEKGREIMCESVERYADKKSKKSAETSRINTLVNNVRLMMKNMKCSLEDALNALEISGNERTLITKQIQK